MSSREKYIATCVLLCYNQRDNVINLANKLSSSWQGSMQIMIIDDASEFPVTSLDINNLPDCIVFNSSLNHGPGFQRNFAVSRAMSKYIIFFDGDDFILPNSVHSLFDQLHCLMGDPDLIIFTNAGVNAVRMLNLLPSLALTILRCFQLVDKVSFANKAFRVQWLQSNRIKYSNRRLYEDVLFHYLVTISKPKTFFFKKTFYQVFIDPSSRSRRYINLSNLWKISLGILSELFTVSTSRPATRLFFFLYAFRILLSTLKNSFMLLFKTNSSQLG